MGLPKNGLVLDSILDAERRQKAKCRRLLCEINIMYEVGDNILVSLLTFNGPELPIEICSPTFLYAIILSCFGSGTHRM